MGGPIERTETAGLNIGGKVSATVGGKAGIPLIAEAKTDVKGRSVARASKLVAMLEAESWKVWWVTSLAIGDHFRNEIMTNWAAKDHRFDLRFLRPFRADLSIKKSSSFFPPLIAVTSQRGLAPRPAQVSPDGPRYFGGTFFPFNALPRPRTTLAPPTTPILSNWFSSSARRL
jgi:hypothetical protein